MASPEQEMISGKRPRYRKLKPSCGTLRGRVVYSRNADGQIEGATPNGERSIIDQGMYTGTNEDCADIEI
ncbi:hypothetical protein [Taklimakanibacter deserti]|uniref:hypothetical protein n=1 Tax=Taklimakanibacter deserti TaxID=2267839 RepID=UPI000E65ACF5